MEPGIDLDKLIAEKIFRISKKEIDGCGQTWTRANDKTGFYLKAYSTDIAAAWEVVRHFTELGWDISVVSSGETRIAESWHAEFYARYVADSPRWGEIYTAPAYSAPHAICLAALKACGIKEKTSDGRS